ncbi:hypothetical protein DFJ73DRAFT_590823 [Zopfochytrium polystomum]|nr:hypothetical protein DFJ73DRAFT_590823 [Zopfochytrium polystomum]
MFPPQTIIEFVWLLPFSFRSSSLYRAPFVRSLQFTLFWPPTPPFSLFFFYPPNSCSLCLSDKREMTLRRSPLPFTFFPSLLVSQFILFSLVFWFGEERAWRGVVALGDDGEKSQRQRLCTLPSTLPFFSFLSSFLLFFFFSPMYSTVHAIVCEVRDDQTE